MFELLVFEVGIFDIFGKKINVNFVWGERLEIVWVRYIYGSGNV